ARRRKRLPHEPIADAADRIAGPLGALRRDAHSLAELAVGDESKGRDERSREAGGERIVDVDVGYERRGDAVPFRLDVDNREGASADRAQKRAGVLAAGQHDDPSWLTLEHLSGPAGADAVAGQIPACVERPKPV